jgi:hypothetical protein
MHSREHITSQTETRDISQFNIQTKKFVCLDVKLYIMQGTHITIETHWCLFPATAQCKQQTNTHRTQLYKVFIQLQVSTLWSHHQADF